MNWFKMLWLNSEERKILREGLATKKNKIELSDNDGTNKEIKKDAPYTKLVYSNESLTVVFSDGTTLGRGEVDKALFTQVENAESKDEIERLLLPEVIATYQPVETQEEFQLVKDNLAIIRDNPEFTILDGRVQLTGVNLSIPALVVASFIEILEKMDGLNRKGASLGPNEEDADKYNDLSNQFSALKMFWLKLALNPLSQSREDMLMFVKHNDVRITNNGNLILYRRIVSQGQTDKALVTFISQKYYDRKKQKKSTTHPRNYVVIIKDDNSGYDIMREEEATKNNVDSFGNLETLYKTLDTFQENTYTSSHNSGKHIIRLGSIYKIDDSEIDLDNGLCAAGGLHAASVSYNYSSFGDTPVVVLVNPSKAITVPRGERGKLRTTEMFIACVNDKRRGIHFDESALAAFDEEYHDLTLSELEEAAKSKDLKVLSIKKKPVNVDLTSLDKIKELLKARVVKV